MSSSNRTKKKRSAELLLAAPSNKRSKQTNDSDDIEPVYQKIIKSGRKVGYLIAVRQEGANRDSLHDALLLGCGDDENPEEYLATFSIHRDLHSPRDQR